MFMNRGLLGVQLVLAMAAMLTIHACGEDANDGAADERDEDRASARDDDDDDSVDPDKAKDAGKAKDGGARAASSDDDDDDETAIKDAGKAPVTRDAGAMPVVPKPSPDAGKVDAATGMVGAPPGATGPDDGDPSKPVVAIPNIACGGPKGFGATNLKVTDRDVMLTYPCDKHEGANVTVLLLLHGTNDNEASKLYTHNYFAAYKLASSHNLIIVEPKSRASQWGNTDKNPAAVEDKPHLLDVVKYVYDTFGAKYNLTSLWVGGHSWGSMYAKRFVCEEAIKDKARGVIGMSGGATAPGPGFTRGGDLMLTSNCADYISQIHTVGDSDSVTGLPDQTAAATKHGCDAKAPAKDLGGSQMLEEWPNCDKGWVHENITMGGHTHTTAINPEVVKQIMEQVKATEKR